MSLSWPLLSRARNHGVMEPDFTNETGKLIPEKRPRCYDIQESGIAPIHLPTIKRPWFRVPDSQWCGSGVKPPFKLCWHEFEIDFETKEHGRQNGFCAVYTISGDDFGFFYVIAAAADRTRKYPLTVCGLARVDFNLCNNGITESIELMYVEEAGGNTSKEITLGAVDNAAKLVCFTWRVISCSNVELVETHPSTRAPKKRKDPSRVVYRELKINPPPFRTKSKLNEDPEHGVALHVRRGHFADYTKGAGLFGKHKVRVWVPGHTVGDQDYGTILKSYSVGDQNA